jgi:alpha-ketoglutarate-dependent taurine dioxygenase
MPGIATKKLGTSIGAEVLDVDRDRLLNDDDLPPACMDALEEHGVLLLRELNVDDETQAAFCRKLGPLVHFRGHPNHEVMEISFDPGNPNVEYSRATTTGTSTVHWTRSRRRRQF